MAMTSKPFFAATLLALSVLSGCKGSKNESKPAPAEVEPRASQCAGLQATGTKAGQVAPDVALQDGDGKVVKIHDYCDKTVLLIAGTMF